jgi:hypothetical protein
LGLYVVENSYIDKLFTTMNIDGDYETGNDDIVQQMNNQYSVHNVEKNLEMEMKREEDTITGT